MNDLISVIVPIYNSEKYLEKCIRSIVSQTYQNIEIILVDDGSTDNSIFVCNKWQQIDKRIVIFQQNNAGAAAARNLGLQNCIGEYVCFVDSDDTIEKEYVQLLHDSLIKNNSDISVCNMQHCYSRDVVVKQKIQSDKLTGVLKNDYQYLFCLLYGPCGKMYKTKIIKDHNLVFPSDFMQLEDQMFCISYYYFVNNITYVDRPLYSYVHRKYVQSLSTMYNEKYVDSAIRQIEAEKVFCECKNILNYHFSLNIHICIHLYSYIIRTECSYKQYINNVKKLYIYFSTDYKYVKINFGKAIVLILLYCRLFFPLYLVGWCKKRKLV